MAEYSSYVPEETPVDDVRRIRERRSLETGNDVRRLFARSQSEAQAAWDALVAAKAAFEHDEGKPAQLLRLPILVAWRLVPRLFQEPGFALDGTLHGIEEVEQLGILGLRVELVRGDLEARPSFE
jgi:hypothetical protein